MCVVYVCVCVYVGVGVVVAKVDQGYLPGLPPPHKECRECEWCMCSSWSSCYMGFHIECVTLQLLQSSSMGGSMCVGVVWCGQLALTWNHVRRCSVIDVCGSDRDVLSSTLREHCICERGWQFY